MGYVLNSCLVSVTHTWGKACLMSQPSKVEQHSPQPWRPITKEEIIISAGSNKFPITQSTGFQLHTERMWPPPTHTLPLAYGFKAKKYLLSLRGSRSPWDQARQEDPEKSTQLCGRSREMRSDLAGRQGRGPRTPKFSIHSLFVPVHRGPEDLQG